MLSNIKGRIENTVPVNNVRQDKCWSGVHEGAQDVREGDICSAERTLSGIRRQCPGQRQPRVSTLSTVGRWMFGPAPPGPGVCGSGRGECWPFHFCSAGFPTPLPSATEQFFLLLPQLLSKWKALRSAGPLPVLLPAPDGPA